MIYSYMRVSSDKQTIENQRFEIEMFGKRKGIIIDKWISETVSGTKKVSDRKLGNMLKSLNSGDVLIVSELSRLGRSLMQIMFILNICMEKNIHVISVKENCEFGDNINSKVLAFAFGLSAEIERNLISQRTKEALSMRRASGMVLGRPKGSRNKSLKLDSKKLKIYSLLSEGKPKSEISTLLRVSRSTLDAFLKRNIFS